MEHINKAGLESHGITNAKSVHWNLSAAPLYEATMAAGLGHVSAGGALVVETGKHTGRSPNDKFLVEEPSSKENIWWGPINRPTTPELFENMHRQIAAYYQGREAVRAGPVRRRRSGLPDFGPGDFRQPLAQPVRAQHVHRTEQRRAGRFQARAHHPQRAVFPCGARTRRHQFGMRGDDEFRRKAGADRRHRIRRRNQEIGLFLPQLRAAGTRRAADALLGQHRLQRRRQHLLRPVGHRQDDAVGGRHPDADRR